MFAVEINYLAVLVCTVIAMAVGALWYSPVLFGNKWMEMTGIQPDQTKATKGYIAAALLNLLMVYTLAHFVQYVGSTNPVDGAITGLWVWIGFVATTTAINYTFEHRPAKIFWINAGMSLVNLIIAGAILATW
jgi:hypothetical protein